MDRVVTPAILTDDDDKFIEKIPQYKYSYSILKDFDKDKLFNSDIFIIVTSKQDYVVSILKQIRGNPDICLKPVIVVTNTKVSDGYEELIDCMLNPESTQSVVVDAINGLSDITDKISNSYRNQGELTLSEHNRINLLRFLISRGKTKLIPVTDPYSKTGYVYITAMTLLSSEAGEEYIGLDALEESGLLKSGVIDTVNLCPYCNHFHINFREVCPSCKSPNINIEKTIHCFACAHIGAESEFRSGTEFICPKCNKNLRHIGIEYDRPNTVYVCTNCGTDSFESLISCLCINCSQVFTTENLLLHKVRQYEITYEATVAAQKGELPEPESKQSIKEKAGLIKQRAFKEILQYHIASSARYKRPFTLIRVGIKNIEDLLKQESRQSMNVFIDEFKELMRGELREMDLVTSMENYSFLILLTETPKKDSDIPLERIKSKSEQLLKTRTDVHYESFGFPDDEEKLQAIAAEI